MATEWYLMQSPHDQVSGFGGEAFNDFGSEGFNETMDSDASDTVELCNYDLSERKTIRVMIQGTYADTKLQTVIRRMLAPIGTCKAGMYVKYKDRYWLIVSLVDDNRVFEKAILYLCNYMVSWIDSNNAIHQRWIYVESASKYNFGEDNMRYYYLRNDQLLAYFPDDEYSMMLGTGNRFIIDKRTLLYEKTISATKDTSNPLIVYSMTRTDNVVDNYVGSGIIGYIMTQGEQRAQDGYYVIDGKGYWLCIEPDIDTRESPKCQIESDSDVVYIDIDSTVFTASFSGDDLPEFEFTVNCDFKDALEIVQVGRSIMISTSDHSLRNKTFEITLTADGYEPATKVLTLREFF